MSMRVVIVESSAAAAAGGHDPVRTGDSLLADHNYTLGILTSPEASE